MQVVLANAADTRASWEAIGDADLVLLMTSTFGSGEPPQSAAAFFKVQRGVDAGS